MVAVREAPGGVKPSWGGFIPQLLGFDLCNRMKQVLTESTRYPYVDAGGMKHLDEKREDLGDLLRRGGHAIQLDGSTARWWTFAGGRVRRAVLAKLPGYRLSKSQDCLPELFALEVVERYLLDMEGTVRWLERAGTPSP